jgi:hypothetical protein
MQLLQNIFLAIFLWVNSCITAQIPGYMGKRFFVDAEIQVFPALLTPTALGNHLWATYYGDGKYDLHSRYGFGMGYVLSRHQILQAHLYALRTGMKVEMVTDRKNGVQQSHDLLNVLTGITFDLAYSRTNPSNGHIAPLGKQKAYHLYMTQINGNHNLYEKGQLISNQLFGSIDARKTIFGIGYSLTYNKVIYDQFLWSYGWRVNLSAPLLLWAFTNNHSGGNYLDADDYKQYNLNSFEAGVTTKFAFYDLMQFKLGFGFLR